MVRENFVLTISLHKDIINFLQTTMPRRKTFSIKIITIVVLINRNCSKIGESKQTQKKFLKKSYIYTIELENHRMI